MLSINVSLPAPPRIESLPPPPIKQSLPAPVPTVIVSLPTPPSSVSLPPVPPEIEKLPVACDRSMVSLFLVPIIPSTLISVSVSTEVATLTMEAETVVPLAVTFSVLVATLRYPKSTVSKPSPPSIVAFLALLAVLMMAAGVNLVMVSSPVPPNSESACNDTPYSVSLPVPPSSVSPAVPTVLSALP